MIISSSAIGVSANSLPCVKTIFHFRNIGWVTPRKITCFSERRITPNLNETAHSSSLSYIFRHFCRHDAFNCRSHFAAKAASSSSSGEVGSAEYAQEPITGVKFPASMEVPGCSVSLSLLGTGYREKVFAIIGVKVYAAGLYVNQSVFNKLDNWKGRPAEGIQSDSSIFESIFQAPLEKSIHIVLVRDVDGKTFWNALDESVSSRIKSPAPADESALSTFSGVFRGLSLKKGTSVYMTWLNPTKMLVSVSTDGIPSKVNATIKSPNIAFALYDVFLGDESVSPSLKASAANGLAKVLV